ncbi:hypothetical protein [Pseudalkalibacillus caeni]|uniref:Uncharacterized protein n=1 Tax=Exobacillus caeni TaxID=2574798 RepID=A0A5R9F7I1_9BACL|nr:hypothetical protein [Pseudalkalibacillus caeni]TLS36464.1 hypothetical protein FCL54_14685 [Pseudalkalibacillus caeni]
MPVRVIIDLLDVIVHKENEIWRNEFLFRVLYKDLLVFERQENIGGFLQVGNFPATFSYNQRIVDETLVSQQNQIIFDITAAAAELDLIFHDQAHDTITFKLPVQSVQNSVPIKLSKRLQHENEGIDVSFHFQIQFVPY